MRRLAGVAKRYGRNNYVLDGVELTIEPGNVVGVVGPNGSGKSTLLRIVAGLARPSRGTVTGDPVTGYVPDRFPGAQRLTALAYLVHMGRISGLSTAQARARGGAWLERLALAGGPDTPLRELSKGNAQKVGLAQALLAEPRLLVLDEPFSGLDESAHGVLGEVLAELSAREAGVVFTGHSAGRTRAHATTTLRLAAGSLRALEPESDATAVVVLTGAATDGWQTEPDVLSAVERSGAVELTVLARRCDEILLLALRRGCSVRHVDRRE
ncbi:ATP-binding cassette domain-containing protein [Prauserella cavernicola]|uniref:ABC transporter ATP-binding protein n=1 Tax=Prauserella cavernicola TaxID=2800127 RepID=A0A934QQ19_9PSEU|nr:ABC transporter ATP-binding protein [Prauserella cavernicola]MBK1784520.1 ABC transporter ATP-binding protein [Prauserella cavernicola]